MLEPLCEIEPWLEHPTLNKTMSTILKGLEDEREVVIVGNFYENNQQ
jgi:hypothetical protein